MGADDPAGDPVDLLLVAPHQDREGLAFAVPNLLDKLGIRKVLHAAL